MLWEPFQVCTMSSVQVQNGWPTLRILKLMRTSFLLKSFSDLRRACRYDAIRAIDEQMERVIKVLIFLSKDKDSKTSSDGRSLLGSVCNFDYILSHCILKFILSNTNALSKYLQGKSVDVINARRNADLTIATLQSCREELHFNNVWLIL